jgi:hypothetical protein
VKIQDTAEEEDLPETEEISKEKVSEETSPLVVVVKSPNDEEADTLPTQTEYTKTILEGDSGVPATGSPQRNENLEQGWAGDGVIDLGASWKESDWFGVYWDSGQGWIYHLRHGWVFPEPSTGQEDGCWMFFSDFGWVYTRCDICPFLYVDSCKNWIYFMQASEELTAFFSFADDTWFHRGEMPPSMIFGEASR